MTSAMLTFLLQASLAGAAQTPSPHFRIVELAEGVYAVAQPERFRFQDSNTVILAMSRDGFNLYYGALCRREGLERIQSGALRATALGAKAHHD